MLANIPEQRRVGRMTDAELVSTITDEETRLYALRYDFIEKCGACPKLSILHDTPSPFHAPFNFDNIDEERAFLLSQLFGPDVTVTCPVSFNTADAHCIQYNMADVVAFLRFMRGSISPEECGETI